MPLFEVAIMELPSKKEKEEGNTLEKLVFGPQFVVATDAQAAALKAVLENPEKAAQVNRDRMAVLVRPFS